MPEFTVRVYEATNWGFMTQADHFMDYHFTSDQPLETFARKMAKEGFLDEDRQRWIMPGSIVYVQQTDE